MIKKNLNFAVIFMSALMVLGACSAFDDDDDVKIYDEKPKAEEVVVNFDSRKITATVGFSGVELVSGGKVEAGDRIAFQYSDENQDFYEWSVNGQVKETWKYNYYVIDSAEGKTLNVTCTVRKATTAVIKFDSSLVICKTNKGLAEYEQITTGGTVKEKSKLYFYRLKENVVLDGCKINGIEIANKSNYSTNDYEFELPDELISSGTLNVTFDTHESQTAKVVFDSANYNLTCNLNTYEWDSAKSNINLKKKIYTDENEVTVYEGYTISLSDKNDKSVHIEINDTKVIRDENGSKSSGGYIKLDDNKNLIFTVGSCKIAPVDGKFNVKEAK